MGKKRGVKVTISIPALNLFLHPRITPFCIFSLTYSCTCLELFPRGQSIQVHNLAKNEWILFTTWKWMQSTHGNSGLRWLTMKIISNSYYFRKFYFLQESSLHPKFYLPIFFGDVASSSNYAKKLKLMGIATTTVHLFRCCKYVPVLHQCLIFVPVLYKQVVLLVFK